MTLSHLLGTALACSLLLFSTAPNAQQPSSEGQCDELIGLTPSLYGLCLAYWATHDEAVGTDKPPANRKILERYRAKMQPGEPDMPGLDIPCPCWSELELTDIVEAATGPYICQIGEPGWADSSPPYYKVSVYTDSVEGSFCSAVVPNEDGSVRTEEHPIDEDEYIACAEDVESSGQDIEFTSCFPL